jgi:hypothetical protein
MANERWKTQPNAASSLVSSPSRPGAGAQDDGAHKMYFLCKTNPMSSHPKIGLTDYITRSYVVFGHLVNGKSKPKQTQFRSAFIPKGAEVLSLLLVLNIGIWSFRFVSDLVLRISDLCCSSSSFYAKRTQFQETPNEPNPLYEKILRQIGRVLKCKKRTQTNPIFKRPALPAGRAEPAPNPSRGPSKDTPPLRIDIGPELLYRDLVLFVGFACIFGMPVYEIAQDCQWFHSHCDSRPSGLSFGSGCSARRRCRLV